MNGWNMTVNMEIVKNFIKGIDKLFEKKKEEDLKKKRGGENVIRQGSRKKPYTRDLEYILICQKKLSQNFKERTTYIYMPKIRVTTMKGQNMTLKMKNKNVF